MVLFRGPRMGGWIRRGWISRFWGAPIFSPEVPKFLFFKGFWDLWTENRGAPKTWKSTTTDPTPHSGPSDFSALKTLQHLCGKMLALFQSLFRKWQILHKKQVCDSFQNESRHCFSYILTPEPSIRWSLGLQLTCFLRSPIPPKARRRVDHFEKKTFPKDPIFLTPTGWICCNVSGPSFTGSARGAGGREDQRQRFGDSRLPRSL